MLKIQNGWRADMNERDVYEKTHGHRKISEWTRSHMVGGFALGVAYGIVRGAYRIDSWFRSEQPHDRGKNRWGFHGTPAIELADTVGTHVRDVFPNQVMYRRFLDGYAGSPVADTSPV